MIGYGLILTALLFFYQYFRQLRLGIRGQNNSEIFQYFANFFEKSVTETKKAMTHHPFGMLFSVRHMKKNVDYLMEKGFSKDDIFKIFYITVYPT